MPLRNSDILHAAMMADFYLPNDSKYRRAFYAKKRHRDGLWIEARLEDESGRAWHIVHRTDEAPLARIIHERHRLFVSRPFLKSPPA